MEYIALYTYIHILSSTRYVDLMLNLEMFGKIKFAFIFIIYFFFIM